MLTRRLQAGPSAGFRGWKRGGSLSEAHRGERVLETDFNCVVDDLIIQSCVMKPR